VENLWQNFVNKPKTKKSAMILALLGAITPLAGVHKFYLRQPLWGVIYLLLWFTPIPKFACAIEAVWYLALDTDEFNRRFNSAEFSQDSLLPEKGLANRVNDITTAIRQLEQLRLEGLITEYEFEQKRRKIFDQII